MSRTTTVDTVPAGEVSVAGASARIRLLSVAPAVYARHSSAVLRRSGHLCPALLCAADPAGAVERVWRVAGQQQYFAFNFHGDVGGGLLFTGPLSDAIGRKPVMVTALLLAACCSLLSTMMTSWHGILIMRALIGLSLSGVAAVGMTYLSEEIHPSFVAFSMGLYISGNSIGGMSGRLLTGSLPISSAGAWHWRRSAALRWPRRLCSGVSCPSRAISARPRCDRKRC